MNLRQAIQKVQELGRQHHFEIVVVGGAIVRLIGPKTIIKSIDESKKQILLKNAQNPTTERQDSKTRVDIDAIAFSTNTDPFEKTVKNQYQDLLKALNVLQKENPEFPPVSLEVVLYHPAFNRPNALAQFVSSIESYSNENFLFRLGGITQEVTKNSLKPWTLTFTDDDTEITTLAPSALQRRYTIRGFALKSKDKEKIFSKNAAFNLFVTDFNKKTDNTYEKDFLQWDEFAQKIAKSKQPFIQIKRLMWNIYWSSIGTYFAHGTGFLGKLLLPLGNTFFAGK